MEQLVLHFYLSSKFYLCLMKKTFYRIGTHFFSGRVSLLLLTLFFVAIGIATFVENSYDTFTAQKIIYKAKWFEILIVLLIINFLGTIKKHQLFKKEKIASLIIHLAFIIIIIGAAITRYYGWDGEMHIREGHQTDTVYVAETSLQVQIQDGGITHSKVLPLLISQLGDNYFNLKITSTSNKSIQIAYKDYIKNYLPTPINHALILKNSIELHFLKGQQNSLKELNDSSVIYFENLTFAYNRPEIKNAIHFFNEGEAIKASAPYDLIGTLRDSGDSLLKSDSIFSVDINNVFNTQKGILFRINSLKNKGDSILLKPANSNKEIDALILDIQIDSNHYEATILGGDEYIARDSIYNFEAIKFAFSYGFTPHKLPFSLYLNDFTLERYPGSLAPSKHTSYLTLIDPINEFRSEVDVSMNNIFDYKGYRFFQMSYDKDEAGTILSVNHDFYGTVISYLGYGMLILGFVLLFFSKNSRFSALPKKIKALRNQRKLLDTNQTKEDTN